MKKLSVAKQNEIKELHQLLEIYTKSLNRSHTIFNSYEVFISERDQYMEQLKASKIKLSQLEEKKEALSKELLSERKKLANLPFFAFKDKKAVKIVISQMENEKNYLDQDINSVSKRIESFQSKLATTNPDFMYVSIKKDTARSQYVRLILLKYNPTLERLNNLAGTSFPLLNEKAFQEIENLSLTCFLPQLQDEEEFE